MNQPGESYFISAGEYSGDLLAAELVVELKNQLTNLQPFGLVGDSMKLAGVEQIAHLKEISIMGALDILKNISKIKDVENQVIEQIKQRNPKFAILVDFPGFHFRLAKKIKSLGIPVYQYVAPKVWAWGQSRVKKLQRDFEMVLGVLPFEGEFFESHSVNYKYVGSPHLDRVLDVEKTSNRRPKEKSGFLVGVLPGSRKTELKRILPAMLAVAGELRARYGDDIKFIMPLASNLTIADLTSCLPTHRRIKENVAEGCHDMGPVKVVSGSSLEIMASMDVGLLASGTATLECAIVGTPMVVMYAIDSFSYLLARMFVKVKFISLVNLLLNREVVKEFIQSLPVVTISDEVSMLIYNINYREQVLSDLSSIRNSMDNLAAKNAARILIEDLRAKGFVSDVK